VGGYLVGLANRVTLRQATPEGYVDVPPYADVSRLHAPLTRGHGSAVLEAMRPSQVNGQQVDIPQAHGATQPQAPQVAYPFTVPDGQVFVMGDNRTFSSDSRTFGPVPLGNIIGKVILRFWPFDRLVFFEW